jgi:S-adenosylmethionine:tRNA ribosyltransferase-isomerase
MVTDPGKIKISDYHYELPVDRIAYQPLALRDRSKLLLYLKGRISDHSFAELPPLIPSGSTLVLNNTRVIEARLLFEKPSGGVIEIFCLQPHSVPVEKALQANGEIEWECLVGGASKWKPGQVLEKKVDAADGRLVLLNARYLEKLEDGFVISFTWLPAEIPFTEVLHAAGNIPLPPYIKRKPTAEDTDRYQTIFGSQEGSVAAPTASLHFTPAILNELEARNVRKEYITLHVGAGTFKPVKSETVAGHTMHGEPFMVTRNLLASLMESQTVIAAGTTTLRTLESIYWLGVRLIYEGENAGWNLDQWEAYALEGKYPAALPRESISAILNRMDAEGTDIICGSTRMMILPGYRIKMANALITNFHQPQSTLLLLVAACIGEHWKKVYNHALENDYRFLSYGDGSLLWLKK